MPTLEETILAFLEQNVPNSAHDIPFTETNGITGTVYMAYQFIEALGRFPEKRELVIKRIVVAPPGRVLTPTLKKILSETSLTRIVIESIQLPEWIPKLEQNGWIIKDDGYTVNAYIQKGGKRRKSRRKKRKSRSLYN